MPNINQNQFHNNKVFVLFLTSAKTKNPAVRNKILFPSYNKVLSLNHHPFPQIKHFPFLPFLNTSPPQDDNLGLLQTGLHKPHQADILCGSTDAPFLQEILNLTKYICHTLNEKHKIIKTSSLIKGCGFSFHNI